MAGLLLFSLEETAFANSPSFPHLRHLYLTWQHDPCRTITINIHGLKTSSELTVYYDDKPCMGNPCLYTHAKKGLASSELSLPDGRKLYHIEIQKLKPNTRYYFIIAEGLHPYPYSKEFSFKTIPEHGDPLVFIEGGDWENTQEAEKLAQLAAKANPHAVLLGGDYPSSVLGKEDFKQWDHWLDVYEKNMVSSEGCLIPLVMAIGNHEVTGGFNQTQGDAPLFFHYFKQGATGESYFSLPFGKKMRLYVLDSGHIAAHEGQQSVWLEQELQKDISSEIKMAIYHVPLFPSVRFSHPTIMYQLAYQMTKVCKGRSLAAHLYSPESAEGLKHWLPLFDAYQLTVAFEHHDQALKRTKLLRAGKEDPQGTLYLGDGGWGAKIHYLPIQGFFHSHFARLKGLEHFFWKVHVFEKIIEYTAINANGKVLDHFVQKVNDPSYTLDEVD